MKKITEQVAEMRLQDISYSDIAQETGLSYIDVSREVRNARQAGILPPKPVASSRNKIGNELRKYCVSRGNVQDTLEILTPEARAWLMKVTPAGGSIAVVLAAITTDAYHEDGGK